MTENKPIMIDGVDVKECTCFSNWHTIMTGAGIIYKEVENCCTPKQKPCKDIKNCCFKKLAKQLARKTQEVEELKLQLTSLSYADTICALEIDLKHKTQECEQVEQKLEKIKDRCNETLELMDKDSGTNAYAGGRCTEAGQILHIIDEVE